MPQPGFSLKWFLFSFQGRIGRLAFWGYSVLSVVTVFSLFLGGSWVTSVLADKPRPNDSIWESPAQLAFTVFMVAVVLVYIWSNYAVLAKRWHDRDKSGWWSLIGLIPYIGTFWIIVECGFLRGTDGPNRFGGDPNPTGIATVFE